MLGLGFHAGLDCDLDRLSMSTGVSLMVSICCALCVVCGLCFHSTSTVDAIGRWSIRGGGQAAFSRVQHLVYKARAQKDQISLSLAMAFFYRRFSRPLLSAMFSSRRLSAAAAEARRDEVLRNIKHPLDYAYALMPQIQVGCPLILLAVRCLSHSLLLRLLGFEGHAFCCCKNHPART